MQFDVVIVGGGPGGLSAALMFGRARKSVLLCDAGERRNERAVHLHNFVTRDGTPPLEFRRLGRAELSRYPSVEVRDEQVAAIHGERDAFIIELGAGRKQMSARRVLLCTGMVDLLPAIEGFREHWGTSIFQCPYCHGWEVADRKFAFLASNAEVMSHWLMLRGWTRSLVALTGGKFEVPDDVAARLTAAGVTLDQRPIARLVGQNGQLARIELSEGPPLDVDVLFARPPQAQVPLVTALGLRLDESGYVEVDPVERETSRPGIFAAGDLTTPMQGATLAAASAVLATARMNHSLTIELALAGQLA